MDTPPDTFRSTGGRSSPPVERPLETPVEDSPLPLPPSPPHPKSPNPEPFKIYPVSPKVIHTNIFDFRNLVHRLTGPPSAASNSTPSATDDDNSFSSIFDVQDINYLDVLDLTTRKRSRLHLVHDQSDSEVSHVDDFSNNKEELPMPQMDVIMSTGSGDSSIQRTGGIQNKRRKDKRMDSFTIKTKCDNIPDDGFSWRKYGQKETLYSRYPRCYYRCVAKHSQGCRALKTLQKDGDDPSCYMITYRGVHKCSSNSYLVPSSEYLGTPFMDEPRVNQMPSMNESIVNPAPIVYDRTQSEFDSNSREFYGCGLPTLPVDPIDGIKNIEQYLKSRGSSDSSIDRTKGIQKRREMNIGMSSLRIKTKSDEIQEDGFTWRKYGEKMILNNPNPRFYFRCENKYTQGCVARKTVQKDEDDPSYYIISYHGEHKCSSSPSWVPSSEYLERCLSYCLLFPPGYEFERDSMVQLWIAEGVIDGEATDRLEDKGYICLELLQSHGYIEPSGLQKRDDHLKFKVSQHLDSKHYASTRPLVDDFLIINKDGFSNLSEILQMRQTLRTLLLLGDSKYLVKQVPRKLFLSLNLLRTLVLSGTQVSELPSSVGNLEDLRYFDLSGTLIRELPCVVCDLVSLQTLRLRDCTEFIALPKGMMKLINLRHLHLDIIHQLSYMPKSIGKLINLRTFEGFIVGTDEESGIGELCQLNNITGSFCISCLENVSNVEEAKKADLRSKSYITRLVLRWEECINSQAEQEILECLLPHPNLSELQIQFFSGSALPSWISDHSFTNLISITFYKCINCSFLPSIGNLPSLQFLNILGMDKVMDIDGLFCNDDQGSSYHVFFPMLEKLIIDSMSQLEKCTVIRANYFPCLHHLSIRNCPRLVELPSMSSLNSLEYLELNNCPELECLPDMPASLGTLIIQDCPKLQEHCRKGEGRDWLKFAHVSNIWIQHHQISPINGSEHQNV